MDCSIVSAALTYEESITFPYSGSASVKNAGTEMTGTAAEIPYADFGMKYEKTADVYAVQFDVTTDQEANQVLVGAGTTMLEKAGFPDNWFQSDDLFIRRQTGKHCIPSWQMRLFVSDRQRRQKVI